MSVRGAIISFGKCAATIQTEQQQYYAPYRELDHYVMSALLLQHSTERMEPVFVTFNVDTTRHSGMSHKKPRYYATSVQLREIVYL